MTAHGVPGCTCWADPKASDPTDVYWRINGACPYHGLLSRERADTGTYIVHRGGDGRAIALEPVIGRKGEDYPEPPELAHHDRPITGAEAERMNELIREDLKQRESGVLAAIRRAWRRFGDWLDPHARDRREFYAYLHGRESGSSGE